MATTGFEDCEYVKKVGKECGVRSSRPESVGVVELVDVVESDLSQ